jgi:hypothetical protein
MLEIRFIYIVLFALLPGFALAQAYRCTVNGQTVYQQAPCIDGKKLDVASPPDPNSRDGRVAAAIAKRQVVIGMTEEEVIRSWGRPDKLNRTLTARTVSEQWIYERGSISQSTYLYMENGVLRSAQTPG